LVGSATASWLISQSNRIEVRAACIGTAKSPLRTIGMQASKMGLSLIGIINICRARQQNALQDR
jgi:hypothetical protein